MTATAGAERPRRPTRSRVLARIRAPARASGRGPASAASCAPSRSPTSTTTSSTSSSAACCAPAAAATCCSRPRAPAAAATAPCPTATCRSPTSTLSPAQWDSLQIPVERRVLLRELERSSGSPRSTRARPAPPSRCCPSTRGTRSWRPTRDLATLLPDVEAFLVRVGRARAAARPECYLVPDRRLLRAGRASCAGCGGASTAGRRPTTRSTRSSTGSAARAEPVRTGAPAVSSLSFEVARRPGRAARGGADAHAAAAAHRAGRPSRSTPSRCGASHDRAAARRYEPDEQARLVELFGETPRWGDTLRPFLWTHVGTTVTGLHRRDRGRPARSRARTTSRSRRPSTSTASTTARSRSSCCSPARSSGAGAGGFSGRAGGVARGGVVPPARRRSGAT